MNLPEPTVLPDSASLNLYESSVMRTITGPAIRPGGLALTDRAMEFCRIPAGARVLDVGCGCGATISHLQKHYGIQTMGLDLSPELLNEAHASQNRIPLVRGRGEKLPFKNESIAALFCECVLSLIAPPEAALREWHCVLLPEGYLILSDIYARMPEENKKSFSLPVHCCLNGAVGRGELFERVRTAGFDILLFEDHTLLLKQLAAQLVWTYGSMAAFWDQWGGECRGRQSGPAGRPGYYLMVARRKGDRHG